jgi:serine/threonine protein kinase
MGRVAPFHPPPRRRILLEGSRPLQIAEAIGRGSAATVYRAVVEGENGLRRVVALKIFDVVTTDERESVLPRLARVARHAAYVRHPNVVETYEFGTLEVAQPYFVNALVEGKSLETLMDGYAQSGQRMPLDLGLFIGTEVAEALLGARLATAPDGQPVGVVHGDLSPRDVLLSWHGEVKVSDFGVSRAVGAASTVQRLATLARRAAAIAPEVAQGHKGDARSDVFSLGVLIHEMLVGPRFPVGMHESERLERARDGYVHTTGFGPQLSEDIRAILQRALAVDPNHRFPHVGGLAYELRRAAMALGVGDGRVFLRTAVQTVLDETMSEERPVASRPTSQHILSQPLDQTDESGPYVPDV